MRVFVIYTKITLLILLRYLNHGALYNAFLYLCIQLIYLVLTFSLPFTLQEKSSKEC